MKYFIFDCNGRVVGNPKGYATFRGADQQQNQRGSSAYNAIWKAYEEKKNFDPTNRLLSKISQVDGFNGYVRNIR